MIGTQYGDQKRDKRIACLECYPPHKEEKKRLENIGVRFNLQANPVRNASQLARLNK